MTQTVSGLKYFALLLPLSGCSLLPQERLLPDETIPHRISEETDVQVWVRRPDGSLVEEWVRIDPGWWVASPQLVDPPPHPIAPPLITTPTGNL